MIEKLAVGPPIQGFPGTSPRDALRESAKGDGSDSFARTLEGRMPRKVSEPPRRMNVVEKKETKDPPTKATTQESGEEPGQKRATTARENAIQKFMDSFESEFGIPPLKMVEAMALLEPQDLEKSPEETAALVIEQLGLPEDEEERAQAMYASLLMELNRIDQRQTSPKFIPQEGATASVLMNQRWQSQKQRQEAFNQSVERLNQNFWNTSVSPQEVSSKAEMAKPMSLAPERMSFDQSMPFDELSLEGKVQRMLDSNLADLPMTAEDSAKLQTAMENVEAEPSKENLENLLREMRRVAEKAESNTPNVKMAPSLVGMKMDTLRTEPLPQEGEAVEISSSRHPSMQGLQASESFEQGSDFDQSSQGFSEETTERSESVKSQKLQTHAMPLRMEDVAAALKNTPPPSVAPGMGAMLARPTEQDMDANVKQLLNQAQYLIKKGGGEVKVEMTPEGMGKVQMKVLLQDGKVNIQMAAETHEAKKAIESSLSELRSSLAAHKLSMENVKVDVVSGPNTDQQASNDANLDQGSQRETQQFWNRFQEQFGNRSQRDGFWDIPTLKGYRQFKAPPPLEPLDPAVKPTDRSGEGKGRGLNLVA